MRKKFRYLIIFLGFLTTSCAAGVGLNTDVVGPGKTEHIGYADFNLSDSYVFSDRWSLDVSEHLFIMGSSDGVRTGFGIKSKIRFRVWEDLSLYAGSGLSIIPDGGDIDGLAHSWLYGTIDFGLSRHRWSLGLDHISSPFHHATDGDSGLNFIKLERSF